MDNYANLDGNSQIEAYELTDEGIIVRFKGNSVYVYDYSQPGREHVEEMKRLAIAGKGLSAYISKHIRKNYAAKLS